MLPFTKLGRYEITKELGRGGMGIVLAAMDPMIDRMVALKIIKFDESLEAERKEELLERFLIEAKAAGKLTHHNIVTIYDVAREEQTYYIAMEFLEGRNLAEAIRSVKKLPFSRATKIILQVAAGLKFAHEKQIIHRDIKPGNIYLIADDHVKILDFGLARLQTASSVTQTGHAVGSPQYMSPEQVRGQKMDGRTDIFSMGVMYYEMLTGTRPFEAESVTSLLYKIMDYDPPTPAMVEGTLPPAVDRVVSKMMAKKAENRYQNCGELIEDLNRLLADPDNFTGGDSSFEKTTMMDTQGLDTTASVDTMPGKEKSKAGLAAAGVLAAVVLWAGYVFFSSSGGQVAPPPAQQAAVETQTPTNPAPPAAAPVPAPVQDTGEKPNESALPGQPPKAPDAAIASAPQPPPMEEKKAAPTSTLVEVASNVPGAVFINGKQAGATPLQNFETPAGEIKVAVKAELHKTWEQTVNAKGGESLRLQAVLEPAGGTVKVTSSPAGAEVLVDGEKIGSTPLLTGAVAPGAHALEIKAPGMAPYRQDITVTKEKPVAVSTTLRPAMGTLAAAGTAGATLYIDGKEAGVLPLEKSLPSGRYELKAVKAGHKPVTHRVEVAVDKQTEAAFELEALGAGTLTITAIPWAEITINGQPSGTTPKTFRNVPEGEVVVTLTNPGFPPVEKTVTVAKDLTTPVAHTFTGQASPVAAPVKTEKAAAFGTLKVKSHPDALVFLDGKLAGKGVVVEVKNLPVGKHKLVVKIGGKADKAMDVNISEGPTNINLE